MLYAPLVAQFALAFPLPRLASVLQAARSAEFCGRIVLFTTHAQPSAARRSRTEYRAGLEPLISPGPDCHRGSLPQARKEDADTTLLGKARADSGRLPQSRGPISIHSSGCERGVGLIESSGESWAQKLHHADTALSRPAQGCFSSAPRRMKRRPSCQPRRLPHYS